MNYEDFSKAEQLAIEKFRYSVLKNKELKVFSSSVFAYGYFTALGFDLEQVKHLARFCNLHNYFSL